MISSDNPANASVAGAAPNEAVRNLVCDRIKKIVQRFYSSDFLQRLIEALGVPVA